MHCIKSHLQGNGNYTDDTNICVKIAEIQLTVTIESVGYQQVELWISLTKHTDGDLSTDHLRNR